MLNFSGAPSALEYGCHAPINLGSFFTPSNVCDRGVQPHILFLGCVALRQKFAYKPGERASPTALSPLAPASGEIVGILV